MRDVEASPVTRRSLLERIEAAPPTDVIAVVEDELSGPVGAHGVSFLIADYLGRAVVRFDRWTWSVPDGREPVVEHSEIIPLPGTVYERVMQTQRVDVARGRPRRGPGRPGDGQRGRAGRAGDAPVRTARTSGCCWPWRRWRTRSATSSW